MLASRDPEGDPPANIEAFDRAEAASADHARAFALLGSIRDGSAVLAAAGMMVPTLPKRSMMLQLAARRREPVSEHVLFDVLDAAQALADPLADLALSLRPGPK